MSEEKKLSAEELEELYEEIMNEMNDIRNANAQDTPEGVARQKAIIGKIDAHPEVLMKQTAHWNFRTIGIFAALWGLFYITIRALRETPTYDCEDEWEDTIYTIIKRNDQYRDRIVNSAEYKEIIARLENQVKECERTNDSDSVDEDMSEYDSIME